MKKWPSSYLLIGGPLLAGNFLFAAHQTAEFFECKIRPLLSEHCFACHSSKVRRGGLDLSTPVGVLKGANSGSVIVKGDPENSRLIQAVRYLGKIKMPPSAKLSEQQIADLTAWVKMGADWPDADSISTPVAAHEKGDFSPEQKAFWSFQPIKSYRAPAVRRKGWVETSIDNFILAELEKKGVAPARPADRLTLLRRATFDLTGLPPTPKDIKDFLADRSPQAFARVVERLLASPQYGERWGRHWLDVARYGDSTGGDEDFKNPHAWRYRDYVIEAFNHDLPYDQFIREQLAGDLLPAEKPGEVNVKGIVATGFLALGPKLLSEQDKPKVFYDIVDEQIDVVGRGIMGLTVACARCHDHKFDPISIEDYYSLASIFASTKQLKKLEGITSQMYFVPLVAKELGDRYQEHQDRIAAKKKEIDEIIDEETNLYATRLRPYLADYMLAARKVHESNASVEKLVQEQGLEAAVLERWVKYLRPGNDVRPHLERWYRATPASVAQVAREYQVQFEATAKEWEQTVAKWREEAATALKDGKMPPEKPMFVAGKDRFFAEVVFAEGPFRLPEKEQERLLPEPSKERLAILRQQWEELKKSSPPEPPMACAVAEGYPVQQHVLIRGNSHNPGPEVPKRFPRILAGDNQPQIRQGSGRLELARWLTDPKNPLTARVMVNRIWQWHFGEGLVRTPSNFGMVGERPTHPKLLDYLATRFVESRWSVKAMHRLITLSSTYRMSSEVTRKKMDTDPSNLLRSRFNSRRLEVEEIRDALLAVDGSLDLMMGGTLQTGSGHDRENDPVARVSMDPAQSRRRTVYLPLRRSNLPSLLTTFDFGDATTTGEGRVSTSIAPQALFMMNSAFVAERSRGFAKYLLGIANSDDSRRIEEAYLLALARKPTADEVESALRCLDDFGKMASESDAKMAAWQSFCWALMASNEFIYVN